MAVDLGVFVFRGHGKAKRVLDEVKEKQLAWLGDVGVIERGKHGRVTVHSSWAQNERDRKGLGWGALGGALLGALLGPGGVLAGLLVGGAAGGVAGTAIDLGAFDKRLSEIGDELKPDSSALMLWAEPAHVDAFVAEFRHHGARLIRSSLTDKEARRLREALRTPDEPPAQDPV
jgi:uncharacterized membrane protein